MRKPKLHLIKLCVGVETIADLAQWQDKRAAEMRKRRRTPKLFHTTRMLPSRAEELLDGGSLYWVIKGQVSVRQRLIGIEPFRDKEGIRRCHLVFDATLVPVAPRPKRAFQGWRYLSAKDAPPDLTKGGRYLPEEIRRELSELGLL